MKKEAAPPVGGVVVLNYPDDEFPGGYAGKVVSRSNSESDIVTIETEPITEITQVFKNLKMGEPIWNDDGTLNPEGGVGVDMAPYLIRMATADGTEIDFTQSGSQITLDLPVTKASIRPMSISTPTVILSTDPDKLAKIRASIQMDLRLFASMSITDYTLEYFHTNVQADIDMKAGVAISGGVSADKAMPLFWGYFAPIPVGPIMIIPTVEFSGTIGVGGELEVSAELSFKPTVNSGFSYTQGEFLTRYSIEPPAPDQQVSFGENTEPSFSLVPSISAYTGVRITAGFKIWAVMLAAVVVETQFKLGSMYSDREDGWLRSRNGFSIGFTSEIRAGIQTLGGAINKSAHLATLEWPPIKKWYITPAFDRKMDVVLGPDSTSIDVSLRVFGDVLYPVQMGVVVTQGEFGRPNMMQPVAKVPLGSYLSGSNTMSATIPLDYISGFMHHAIPAIIINGEYNTIDQAMSDTF